MKIKLFTVPIENVEDFDNEINSFLSNNRVISLEKHFVENQEGAYWCFYISYDTGAKKQHNNYPNSQDKIDYRNLLSDEHSKLYDILRLARKKIAHNDAVSAFVVATNEELFYISQMEHFTLAQLKKSERFWRKKSREIRPVVYRRAKEVHRKSTAEMKRAGNLIGAIADLNNLYNAFRKAAKGKRQKPAVLVYEKFLEEKLKTLQKQIETGKLAVGNYHYFTIYEPKERLICAASFPERVLHHALMNVCHPYFENQLIYDSYATRINKGTYKAIERARHYSKHYKYYLKLDIKKYFDSIAHSILLEQLKTVFKDPYLIAIFWQIMDSYNVSPGRGVPIGNLTSQYFANHYLAKFDRFIKQTQMIKPYVRYMDDFILWAKTPQALNRILPKIENYLNQNLSLQLKVSYINTTLHGLNFLSYRIFNNRIELQQKAKKRFIKKLALYENKLLQGEFIPADYQRHVLPLVAFTEHASAKGFRKKVFGYQ